MNAFCFVLTRTKYVFSCTLTNTHKYTYVLTHKRTHTHTLTSRVLKHTHREVQIMLLIRALDTTHTHARARDSYTNSYHQKPQTTLPRKHAVYFWEHNNYCRFYQIWGFPLRKRHWHYWLYCSAAIWRLPMKTNHVVWKWNIKSFMASDKSYIQSLYSPAYGEPDIGLCTTYYSLPGNR